jgi:protein-S-isoprenylcysteine O-methyltransferase Ste14
MSLNQGLGVGCMAALHAPRWEQAVSAPLDLAAGVALFGVCLVVKLWATLTAGMDVYYFRDMFLRRPLAACDGGPYRFLRNPMYSAWGSSRATVTRFSIALSPFSPPPATCSSTLSAWWPNAR